MRVKSKFNTDRSKALFGEPDHPELCKRIAAAIPAEKLRKGRILDCGIGCGGIARAIVNRMVNELYIDHYDAILRVYGIDTNQALVSRARRLGFVNTVCEDFLTWDPEMLFDVVIGNPPYQKSKYSDFYVCFVRKAAECLKEGGYFSMIMPAKGANPMSRAQAALSQCGWNSIELGVERYFPNVATVIGHYRGEKGSAKGKLTVVVGSDTLEVDRGTVLPLGTTEPLAYSVVAKIFGNKSKMPFYRTKQEPAKNYVYVSRMIGTWHPAKTKGGPYALQAFVNECPGNFDGGFLSCDSIEQAEQFAWLMSRSLVMRFAVNQCARAAFIPPLFWSLTPDLVKCKNDKDIYKLLGFTKEEQAYITSWEIETYK